MDELFSDVLTQYKTKNFQNWVLFNYLNITVVDDDDLQAKIDGEIEKTGMEFYSYDVESEYMEWITGNFDWLRPYQKKSED